MAKIAIVGAGGFTFPTRMCIDIFAHEALRDSEIRLMDIDARRNNRTAETVRKIIARHKLPAKVVATTSLKRALAGAGYIVVTWQVGGVGAFKHDVEVPRKYGVDQTVGDTAGPGGIFRMLRSAGPYLKLARTVLDLCPGALIINYANPMTMNCMVMNSTGVKSIGLCHSVQGTSALIASELRIPYDQLDFICAGINHQAWFTKLERSGRDLYPRLRKIMDERYPSPLRVKKRTRAVGGITRLDREAGHGELYHQEEVRAEIMRMTGYFQTESSHHASEYMPWFRKNKKTTRAYIKKRWDYYEICSRHDFGARTRWALKAPLEVSREYGSGIIDSMETGTERLVYGSVPNWGPPGTNADLPAAHIISNLPITTAVEVGCMVDRNGIQPMVHGPLPTACAAVNQALCSMYELAVEGAITGSRESIHQAVAMDPLTSALLTLPEIRAMVEEMFDAQKKWLPRKFYRRSKR